MKPPPAEDIDTGATAGLLNELSLTVRSGGLVRLLKGEGLDRNTVEDLLRPESIWALRAILTDRLFADTERSNREDRRDQGDNPGTRPAGASDHGRDARPARTDGRAAASSRLFRTGER